MLHPTYRITHTMAFVTPVVEHWLEREIAQWVHCRSEYVMQIREYVMQIREYVMQTVRDCDESITFRTSWELIINEYVLNTMVRKYNC